jgi:hypothetical protein
MPNEEATPLAIPGATGAIATELNSNQYLGITCQENGAPSAAASIVVYDGHDATGPILESITLNGGESDREHYPRPGRMIASGRLYCVITGAIKGSLFT